MRCHEKTLPPWFCCCHRPSLSASAVPATSWSWKWSMEVAPNSSSLQGCGRNPVFWPPHLEGSWNFWRRPLWNWKQLGDLLFNVIYFAKTWHTKQASKIFQTSGFSSVLLLFCCWNGSFLGTSLELQGGPGGVDPGVFASAGTGRGGSTSGRRLWGPSATDLGAGGPFAKGFWWLDTRHKQLFIHWKNIGPRTCKCHPTIADYKVIMDIICGLVIINLFSFPFRSVEAMLEFGSLEVYPALHVWFRVSELLHRDLWLPDWWKLEPESHINLMTHV